MGKMSCLPKYVFLFAFICFGLSNNTGSASVGSVTIDGKIYNQISFLIKLI